MLPNSSPITVQVPGHQTQFCVSVWLTAHLRSFRSSLHSLLAPFSTPAIHISADIFSRRSPFDPSTGHLAVSGSRSPKSAHTVRITRAVDRYVHGYESGSAAARAMCAIYLLQRCARKEAGAVSITSFGGTEHLQKPGVDNKKEINA